MYKGKKVYRVVFDRAYNDVFQKKNSDGKVTGYYPISQEYGFLHATARYIPGYRFIQPRKPMLRQWKKPL